MLNGNVKYMMMFLAFGAVSVIAITAIYTVKTRTEEHNDHVNLDKSEKDAWYGLVNNYHSH